MNDLWDRLNNSVEDFAPQLLGAVAILIVGWVVAWLVSGAVKRLLHHTHIDNRIAKWMGIKETSGTEAAAGRLTFWTIMLLVLIAVLETLSFQAVTEPLNNVVDDVLGFLPNFFAAIFILLIGYIVARIVRAIVTNFADALGVDRLGNRAGLSSDDPKVPSLSEVVGLVAFTLVLIPTLVAALNALELQDVSRPASNMLDQILAAMPDIFAAAALLVIAYLVARLVQQLATRILAGLGVDGIPQRLGASDANAQVGGATLSQIAGYLLFAGIMLIAAMEAADQLGFNNLTLLIEDFMTFAGQVLLGLVIIAIGFWLAGLAGRAIRASQVNRADLVATIGQAAIIFIAIAIGLGEMGIAQEIVILAFALPLGAVSLGLAIGLGVAVGLGGRSSASRLLESITDTIQGTSSGPSV